MFVGRKTLPHETPSFVRTEEHPFFITICAKQRGSDHLLSKAKALLDAVRKYEELGKWYPHIFLIMPDHLHGLISVTDANALSKIVTNWKSWTTRHLGVVWLDGYFDHRTRNDASAREKADYILMNPVRAGLTKEPGEWPHVYIGRGTQ